MQLTQSIRKLSVESGKWFEKPIAVPFTLLLITIACYGLLVNRLGYFWDDFPLAYIKNIFGSAGLERYFSTNRPFWGLLYQVTFSVFNQPWQWQINALVWRWISAVILWLLLREVWVNQKSMALWASMLFLVYPGFKQQHISVIYGNLFIVLDCFLLSLYINIKTARTQFSRSANWKAWLLQGAALLLALFNLLTLEYFFALELIRPFLLGVVLGRQYSNVRIKISKIFMGWLPFLLVWIGVVIWRVFFFSFQTHNYQMLIFQSLRESFFPAILSLLEAIASSLWIVIISAWAQIFSFTHISELGLRTTAATLGIILISLALIMGILLSYHRDPTEKKQARSFLFVGAIASLLGGIPWWLTELPPGLRFPSDRFTLPFLLGVSLMIAGLVYLFPIKGWFKPAFISVLVAFSVGSQFQSANQYRRDWETQRRFFWQLAWRIPGLKDGTTLMVNDLPVTYYSDNSLTAPLNWFWAKSNSSQEMAYLLLYPSQRLGSSLKSLAPNTPINVDYLAAKFNGNTNQTVAVFYQPPACLRVLDMALDSDNRMLPMEMQAAATLSSIEWIQPQQSGVVLPPNLYSSEPEHRWCYYFEMADLARQQGNWKDVASIGDVAYELNDYPNDPSEHLVFVEGYAHNGNWDRSLELTEQALSITPTMEPVLCRLWQRINDATDESSEKASIFDRVGTIIRCEQYK